MKKTARIMGMVMTLVMVIAFTGCGEKNVTALVSISVAGDMKCMNEEVSVTDVNGNGIIDMDDALKTVSESHGEKYESADAGYGLGIANLWGDDSGAFGYYLNDQMASNLEEEIADGACITVYSYMDTAGFSDAYTYFAEKNVKSENGEAAFTLMKVTLDKDFNPVAEPCEGATVSYEGGVLGKTDKDGNISFSLDEKEHVILAEGEGLVPSAALLNGE